MLWKKVRLPAFLITTAMCCMGDGCGNMGDLYEAPSDTEVWYYTPEQVCGWNAPAYWSEGTIGAPVRIELLKKSYSAGGTWTRYLDTIYSGPIHVPCPASDSVLRIAIIQNPQDYLQ